MMDGQVHNTSWKQEWTQDGGRLSLVMSQTTVFYHDSLDTGTQVKKEVIG